MRTVMKGTRCKLNGLLNDGVVLFDRKKKIKTTLLKEKESDFRLPIFCRRFRFLFSVYFFALNFYGSLSL